MQGLRIVIVDEQERLARSQVVEGIEDSAVPALAWGRPQARILLRLQTVRPTGRHADQLPRDHIAALIAFIEEHYAGVFPRERTRDLRGDQSKTGSSRL